MVGTQARPKSMANISVLTLTFNERLHIERCIRSAQQFARQVFVVDSGSDDGTVEIARSLGAHVVHHAWENHHGRQVNWAIDNLPIETDWVFRMDADEWVTPELAAELNERLDALPADVSGVVLQRRMYAFGKQLRWGGQERVHLLRIWRRGLARCEERWMDEHIQLSAGRSVMFRCDFADDNLKPLSWWISKHANYAVREVADTLLARSTPEAVEERQTRDNLLVKWLKRFVYAAIPRFVRPLLFFVYRYFVRLGFLDGAPGLIWHVLQAFWYRFLIDSILYDVERRAAAEGVDALTVLERSYGMKLR
ncbi:MAG TPA: glycosyltransferase family 2 protein [Polyangiales bacterium]|nr:glycosyltransferase family 2 protein [Polyangiales bacterium]